MYSLILHHGKKSLELHKWRNLIVPAQNVFSAFPSSFFSVSAASDGNPTQDIQKGKVFDVSYLVKSLGFTKKLAESISKKVNYEDKGDPDSVLSLLKSYGFTEPQISSIVSSYPRLFTLDAEKSLGPKLQFLQSRGASTSELTEIVSKVPKILGMSWQTAISSHYDFVRDIVKADESSKRYETSSLTQNKFRNISALRELGVPQKLLFDMLLSDHRIYSGKEKFEKSLKKVVEIGFNPTTSRFLLALRVFYEMSEESIEEKVGLYKRLGLTERDVWAMIKKWPKFLAYSEEKILGSIQTFEFLGFSRDECELIVKRFPLCIAYSAKELSKKTTYLLHKMDWPRKALVSNTKVLGYSMEKRIIPRCNVITALLSKGLLLSGLPSMSYVLVCTDEIFLKRYVKKHDDNKELVAELMAIFTGGVECDQAPPMS